MLRISVLETLNEALYLKGHQQGDQLHFVLSSSRAIGVDSPQLACLTAVTNRHIQCLPVRQ